MKLRWIDSKSKRLQEVFIDLNAILQNSSSMGGRLAAECGDAISAERYYRKPRREWHYFRLDVRSDSQIISWLLGEATLRASCPLYSGAGFVLESTHFRISAWPSANEIPAAPLW